jgi:RNA polymerase sigma-70 factor (ECF subfamily)
MAQHFDLAEERMGCASSADRSRPGHGVNRGKHEMFDAIYAEHASALRRFAAGLAGDHSNAEDVVQETMLRAWRHHEMLGKQCGNVRSWLFTVAGRVAIDQHRARRARPAEIANPAMLAYWAAPDEIDGAITRLDLAAALNSLHPRERDLLAAHYLRDHNIAEIAAAQHVPVGTVKSRLARARQALRRQPGCRKRPHYDTSQ